MASGPITSWKIDGEIMETVTDFIYFFSKILDSVEINYLVDYKEIFLKT